MAQRAKAAVMSIASSDKQTMVEKLWGNAQPTALAGSLAYASADAGVTGGIIDTRSQNPMMGGAPPYDRRTAVYDHRRQDGVSPRRHQARGAFGPRLEDGRRALFACADAGRDAAARLRTEAARDAVSRRAGAAADAARRRGKNPRPRRIARALLHARSRAASPTAASRSRTITRSSMPTRTRASAALAVLAKVQ